MYGALVAMPDGPLVPERIDQRQAAFSDNREREVLIALSALDKHLQKGSTVELIWPTESAAGGSAFLGMSLAMYVMQAAHESSGEIVVHVRSLAADFLQYIPEDQITFVFHLNSEETAMRWEREDAGPAKRLAMATRMRRLAGAPLCGAGKASYRLAC